MKAIVCEMCDSRDLIKQDGVYVCQNCGTKYSVEEAKKLMIDGVVEVKGTVKIDNTDQINKYLDLSRNAYKSGNGESAFDYANKALEIDPQNSEAWICKMMSIEYMGTLGNLKLMEVIEAGKNAISYADQDKKESIEFTVYGYQLTRAMELIQLAMNKLADVADIRNTYKRLCMVSVLTATSSTMNIDKGVVNIYDKIADEARAMVLLIPDDVLGRSKDLARVVGECAKQYQYETDALTKRYAVYGAELTAGAKSNRAAHKEELEIKAQKAMQKAQIYEEKKAQKKKEEAKRRLEEYWESHIDEKNALETEKSELTNRLAEIKPQVDAIEKQRSSEVEELRKRRDTKLPEALAYDRQEEVIDELERQIKKCGIFKGKEKKELQDRVASEKQKLEELKKERDRATNRQTDAINKQIMEAKEIGKEITNEYAKINNRIKEIDEELTKPR